MSTRDAPQFSLQDYVQMLWRLRWLILAFVVAATLGAMATQATNSPSAFQATVALRVQTYAFTGSPERPLVRDPVPGIAPTEVEAARSAEAAAATAKELGMGDRGLGLLSRLAVTASTDSDILRLGLRGGSERTFEVLGTYARSYARSRALRFRQLLERRLTVIQAQLAELRPRLTAVSRRLEQESAGGGSATAQTRSEYDNLVTLYDRLLALRGNTELEAKLAQPEVEVLGAPIARRISPLPVQTLRLIAFPLAGLLAGCAIAAGLGVLMPVVGDRRRLERRLGLPVLAEIPVLVSKGLARSSSAGLDAMQSLRNELELAGAQGRDHVKIVVTSPEPGDGKSTIAANLDACFDASGSNTAAGHRDPKSLRSNHEPPTFSEGGGVAVLDIALRASSVDSLLAMREADLVVLVVRKAKTKEEKAAQSVDLLSRQGAKVAGLVINCAPVSLMERLHRFSSGRNESFEPKPSQARTPSLADEPTYRSKR
jgi:Mrp family chromosome partitioning ATPase